MFSIGILKNAGHKMKNKDHEPINPDWASRKGSKPTQDSYEDSRHNWRKVFYVRGVKAGKRVKKAMRRWSRETFDSSNFY